MTQISTRFAGNYRINVPVAQASSEKLSKAEKDAQAKGLSLAIIPSTVTSYGDYREQTLVVLTGEDARNYQAVRSMAESLGMADEFAIRQINQYVPTAPTRDEFSLASRRDWG